MLIRNYIKEDIKNINKLGATLHFNYQFKLDDFSNCLVIEDDDIFLGFIIYSIIYERAEIVDIIINPNYRNKGYGYLLIDKVINDIKDKDVDNITLEVNQNNLSAIRLYEKQGFKICAQRKNYYNDQDGYLMKKDLR